MLCLSIALAACGGAGDRISRVPTPVIDTSLGPEDVFDVRVYGEADLSGQYRVSRDGSIDYPFLGRIRVGGMEPPDAAAMIRLGLIERGYVRDPQVSVLVREYNSKKVSVYGQVQRPGTFAFTVGMNIVQIITLAGGFTPMASRDSTTVIRRIGGRERNFQVRVDAIGEGREPNFLLQPGDIVMIPERFF